MFNVKLTSSGEKIRCNQSKGIGRPIFVSDALGIFQVNSLEMKKKFIKKL